MKKLLSLSIVAISTLALAQTGVIKDGVQINDAKGSDIGLSASRMKALMLNDSVVHGVGLRTGYHTYIELNSKPEGTVPGYSTISTVWSTAVSPDPDLSMLRIEVKVCLHVRAAASQFENLKPSSSGLFAKLDSSKELDVDDAMMAASANNSVIVLRKGRVIVTIASANGRGRSIDQLRRASLEVAKREAKLLHD